MGKPTVWRLTDWTEADSIKRDFVRQDLGEIKDIKDCQECPKPVWVTVFFDGTGNNFVADGDGKLDPEKVSYSNIAKFAAFAHAGNDKTNRTHGIYVPGVGTKFAEIGDSGDGIDKAAGMSTAKRGEDRINWAFQVMSERVDSHLPLVSQINIAVLGFSRGAAMSRAFVRRLSERYGTLGGEMHWPRGNNPTINVYFLGIFDTVASVGYGGSKLESAIASLPSVPTQVLRIAADYGGHAGWASDLRIPSYVKKCVHYVASHEVREKFPSDSVRESLLVPDNCEEYFYPGAHSDVGGGYAYGIQEWRSAELSRIPLCNMFREAYAAGVPFFPPAKVIKKSGTLFEITTDLEECFNSYISWMPENYSLEKNIIVNMNFYYHWRWGRSQRMQKLAKSTAGVGSSSQHNLGSSDPYMRITDEEWNKDVQNIAEKKTGSWVSSTTTLEDAIFDAWRGGLRKMLPPDRLRLFDRFFDYYVHDSVAGFKQQMSESHIGFVESSRWTKNRRYFLGKRGKKFLYWTYEGNHPESQRPRVAVLRPDGPSDHDSIASA
ncbi:T6SS phospholipase effector Tle1-like catalytic domain-containing protein [Pseudoduganella plicata]|uniref:T6SS Phospholipase effector Tle1-like catalytic domain-containing protein n=1 Tax=Pseudoduganella plicata TaxID=321984 RepID=A0AA88CEA1_9BURK|nr:DUF2235 domain-containing protein [Pseudoduganella plicata]GGZ05353.1 hypothetical protein GCM10007388_43820 [Pseudoduganella plicata]